MPLTERAQSEREGWKRRMNDKEVTGGREERERERGRCKMVSDGDEKQKEEDEEEGRVRRYDNRFTTESNQFPFLTSSRPADD